MCPRCGKRMKAAEWPAEGRVLSFVKLGIDLDGHKRPMNLLLVGVQKGPKIVCWTDLTPAIDETVLICPSEDSYYCFPKESPARGRA
jgi:uncharacterized OB-fold protein